MAFSTFPDGGYTIGFSALPHLPIVGGSALPAARYWRLLALGGDAAGSNGITIADVEMATSAAGANVCTGGTVSASPSPIGPATNCFDGNVATTSRWSNSNPQFTLQYSFAAAQRIAEIRVRASGTDFTSALQGFTPQYSLDNATWVSCEPCGPTGGYTNSQWKSFAVQPQLFVASRATARLWRISNIAGGNTFQEAEFRASSGGANLCVGGFAYANSALGGNAPNGMFDGNAGTKWVGSAGGHVWYFFPTAPNPTHLALTAGGGTAPSSFDVDWSYDGVTWTTVATITGQTGWGANETRVFAI